MIQKGNVVLYLDKELVEKSKELGFNLSKTFENHLKHLMTRFSIGNSINNFELCENKMNMMGLPVPILKRVQNLSETRSKILNFQSFHRADPMGFDPEWGRNQYLKSPTSEKNTGKNNPQQAFKLSRTDVPPNDARSKLMSRICELGIF